MKWSLSNYEIALSKGIIHNISNERLCITHGSRFWSPCIIILILMHVSPWHEFNFKLFFGGVKPLFEDKKHGLKLY